MATGAQAAYIDESAFGDFDNVLGPGNDFVGSLDSGYNDIIGSLMGSCAGTSCNDGPDGQDSFEFAIFPGLQLDSISATMEGYPRGITWSIYVSDENSNVVLETFPMNSGGALDISGLDANGSYSVAIYGQNPGGYVGDWAGSYNISINTSPVQVGGAVPLPASAPLLLAGLGAAGLLRRRARAS